MEKLVNRSRDLLWSCDVAVCDPVMGDDGKLVNYIILVGNLDCNLLASSNLVHLHAAVFSVVLVVLT